MGLISTGIAQVPRSCAKVATMSESVRSRRVVALLAAYVVALQALLLPLSVAAGTPAGSSLCASAASTSGSLPASHQPGCPCAAGCGMQCCAQAAVGPPPQIGIALAVTRAIAMTPALIGEPVQRPSDFGPQVPRAPPTA
jgi:hypothetical protein